MRTSKIIVGESLVAATLLLAVSYLVWPSDLGLSSQAVHPIWIGIVVLAARYGPQGLVISLLISGGAAFTLSQTNLVDADFFARLQSRQDLIPLLVGTASAFVAMSHLASRRRHRDDAQERELEMVDMAAKMKALEKSVEYLRGRCDRMTSSISVWRRVAHCFERGDIHQASDAAMEIACQRIDARNAFLIEVNNGGVTATVHGEPTDNDFRHDQTVMRAIQLGQIQTVFSNENSNELDSDVAVPIKDPIEGDVVGVIALLGTDPVKVQLGELSDLEQISDWIAPIVARQQRGPRLKSTEKVAVL